MLNARIKPLMTKIKTKKIKSNNCVASFSKFFDLSIKDSIKNGGSAMVFVDNQTYPVEIVKARFDEYYNV